jgi:hypothetical protein
VITTLAYSGGQLVPALTLDQVLCYSFVQVVRREPRGDEYMEFCRS